MSALNKVYKIMGSKTALAKALGLKTVWGVSKWEKTQIPLDRCPQIEAVTKGQVTREELRPDFDWGRDREP